MSDKEKALLECAKKIKEECLRRKEETGSCTGCVLECAGCDFYPSEWELPAPEIEATKADSTATVDKPRLCEVLHRLGEIEDILGQEYDLDHLRELVERERQKSRPCGGAAEMCPGVRGIRGRGHTPAPWPSG